MRIYAMSDIHGCARLLEARLAQLERLGFRDDGCRDELVLLGDYVDRGSDSLGVLDLAMGFCGSCPGRVFPLAGNHEDELLGWLGTGEPSAADADIWLDPGWDWDDGLGENLSDNLFDQAMDLEGRMLAWRMVDKGAATMRSLLGPAGWRAIGPSLRRRRTMVGAFGEACERIHADRAAQIAWLRGLRDVRETDRQIFVHAGVDERLGEDWRLGTPREDLLNDRSCGRGSFVKDVVAGHTSTSAICGDPDFHGILWDGSSHLYIDGATPSSGILPLLVWESCDGSYWEMDIRGDLRRPRVWDD